MTAYDGNGEYAGEPETMPSEDPLTFEPINFADLAQQRPERGPAVIDGILREGAVGTVISGTKGRKSFAIAAIIAAALGGGKWFGHAVAQGRVALIDGELTRATIYFRLSKVFESLSVNKAAFAGLDIFDLRGRTKDAARAIAAVQAKGPGYYKLICIDPLYCFYPPEPNFNENDNAAMRRVYDAIIGVAGETRAAIVVVHHASKGNQAEKGLTDLGSGAGAISRAGDAHIAFRPHQEKDAVVFDGVVRDFPELVPTCWRWSFPTFTEALDLDPENLAGKKPRKSATEEFLAGDKSKPTAPTLDEFVAHFVSAEPRQLAFIQAQARASNLKPKTVEQLLREAVALGKVFKADGKTGPGGKVARYATTPFAELVNSLPVPPTPPKGEKTRLGAGAGRVEQSTERKNT